MSSSGPIRPPRRLRPLRVVLSDHAWWMPGRAALASGMRWQVAELIDVEAMIAEEARLRAQGGETGASSLRDRRLAAAIRAQGAPADEQGWLQAWVSQLRRERDDLPGRRAVERWRLIGAGLLLLALAAGFGAAAALLRYDGRTPVNLVPLLAGLVGLPGLLLLVSILLQLPWLTRRASRLGGPLPDLLAGLCGRWLLQAQRSPALVGGLLRHRDGRYLYAPLARWLLVCRLQAAGVAFVLGSILALWWIALGSDLAFGWHSTLLDTAAVRDWVAGLSRPWQAWWPQAVPAAALIEESRYVLLEGRFVGAGDGQRALDPAELHRWWPFILGCLLVWALLPRLAFYAWCRWRLRRASAAIALTDEDHRRVVARLQQPGPVASFIGASSGAPPSPSPSAALAAESAERPTGPVHLVGWIGGPELAERARQALDGVSVASTQQAGAEADLAGDRAALEAVAADPRPVYLLAEAAEPPLTEVQLFIQELRQAAAGAPVIVLLAGAAEDRQLWQEALAAISPPVACEELP